MPRVYVETSVVSYLTARLSRDPLVAARQRLTVEWWASERPKHEIAVSRLVIAEASKGDPTEAGKRLDALTGIPRLEISDEATAFAKGLLEQRVVPTIATEDALHLAIAVTNGMDFLLTWNCKHLANAVVIQRIEKVCRDTGYAPVVLCTPEQLTEP